MKMKLLLRCALAFYMSAGAICLTSAATPEAASVSSPALLPATAGGDSSNPIISPDGRYVLFASTANNLATNGTNVALASFVPARINVFLRDRVNGTTTLVSINAAGTRGGNGDSIPNGLSTNGAYALFESSASDLVPGDTNNVADVFLRDLIHGTTTLISASTNGSYGNKISGSAVMTPDAHYVAFSSVADNLVVGDTNGIQDIFVRDLQIGQTTLASPDARKALSGFVWQTGSDSPQITPDGHYVAFLSAATNLVPGVGTAGEIYVRDLIAGTTVVASTNTAQVVPITTGANRFSCDLAISDDGRFVGFETTSSAAPGRGFVFQYDLLNGVTDLVYSNAVAPATGYRTFRNLDMTGDGRFMVFAGRPGSAVQSSNIWIYLWDSQSSSMTLASVDEQGGAPTNAVCVLPAVESAGRFISFLSTATNLTTNAALSGFHLYVRDTQQFETILIDSASNGTAAPKDFLSGPALSADGRFVAFDCTDIDIVPDDNNGAYDVFVNNIVAATNDLISRRIEALPSATAIGTSSGPSVSVSADGSRIAFASNARNIVPNYTNVYRGIFVRDLLGETNVLVSTDTNGLAGADGTSAEPVISANGRYVVFTSSADNLVARDTNVAQDVFLRDLQSATTSLVSVNTNGVGPGNGRSYSPEISADARFVLFRSHASNLAAGSSAASENLVWRDLQSGVTYNVTPNGVSDFAMTLDGRFVAFGETNGNVYVWDSQLPGKVYTNNTPGVSSVAISADGNRVAAEATSQIYISDRAAQTNWLIIPSGPPGLVPHGTLQFSGSGRLLVYTTRAAQISGDTNSAADVFLYDFQTGSNALVSQSYLWPGAGNGRSDSPCISPDGRSVAYRSFATDIVPGATNGQANIFLYDQQSATTTLVSASAFGSSAGNSSSFAPLFSADGQTLVFQSWSSDLVAHDFNQNGDVFALKLSSSNAVPVYSCQIVFVRPSDESPTIRWPAAAGKTYQVQFKNNLTDASWQAVDGSVAIVGNQGYAKDFSPNEGHRFYRVLAF